MKWVIAKLCLNVFHSSDEYMNGSRNFLLNTEPNLSWSNSASMPRMTTIINVTFLFNFFIISWIIIAHLWGGSVQWWSCMPWRFQKQGSHFLPFKPTILSELRYCCRCALQLCHITTVPMSFRKFSGMLGPGSFAVAMLKSTKSEPCCSDNQNSHAPQGTVFGLPLTLPPQS